MGLDLDRNTFIEALKRKFEDPLAPQNAILELQSFKQMGTLESFVKDFTVCSLDMNLKEMLCLWFGSGLKPNLRQRLDWLDTKVFDKLIWHAQRINAHGELNTQRLNHQIAAF
jgi:hypothetical protein